MRWPWLADCVVELSDRQRIIANFDDVSASSTSMDHLEELGGLCAALSILVTHHDLVAVIVV